MARLSRYTVQLHLKNHNQPSDKRAGFTLVEMLVIAPLVLLVIAALISAMIAMIGDTLVASSRADTAYSMQDTLSQIEQDSRVATNFMSSFSYLKSPQGRDGSTGSFSFSSYKDLILTQQATTASPYNDTRDLVYYANQPTACNADLSLMSGNRSLNLRVVYFLLTNSDGTKTLWRRTILNDWNKNATADGSTVCNNPWQRSSCPVGSTVSSAAGATCQAIDQRMLDNVTSFIPTFYTSSGSTTTNPASASSVSVAITVAQKVSGNTVSQTSAVRATRRNDVPATPVPSTPTIARYQTGLADKNNANNVTVQWNSANAYIYSYQYKVGAGAWTTAKTTASTTYTIPSQPGAVVQVKVIGINDSGQSASTTETFTTDIFTDLNLYGGWQCYSTYYFCPQFTKLSSGAVVLHGMAKAGSGTIAQLPPGFRPSGRLIFTVLTGGDQLGRVDIESNGNVTLQTGSNAWVSLDGIQFPPNTSDFTTWAQPSSFGCNDSCTTPWRQYGGTYQDLQYTKDIYGRVYAYGLLKTQVPYPPSSNSGIAGIPSAYYIRSGTYRYVATVGLSNNSFASSSVLSSAIYYRSGPSSWQSFSYIYPSQSYTGTWTNATLQNSWVNYNASGWAQAQYSKEADNFLLLEGSIKSGSLADDTLITDLPDNLAPSLSMIFVVVGRDGSGTEAPVRIDVKGGSGEVRFQFTSGKTYTNTWLNLDGIQYYVDGS